MSHRLLDVDSYGDDVYQADEGAPASEVMSTVKSRESEVQGLISRYVALVV